jgi:hypothetical protein
MTSAVVFAAGKKAILRTTSSHFGRRFTHRLALKISNFSLDGALRSLKPDEQRACS